MNKFNVGEVVLYQNGSRNELGVIKEVVPTQVPLEIRQDRTWVNHPTETRLIYRYRVWYHTGDTTALTDESLLKPVSNAGAFLILRRVEETGSINDTPARQLACMIIEHVSQLDKLKNEAYYATEDKITEYINGYKEGTY